MEVLDLNLFLSFKNYNETQDLDNKTLELLNGLFSNVDKKDIRSKNKKQIKSGVNILKNQKIQNKKDSIINRVNMILNKLSESNIDILVKEFVENINQVDNDGYEEIMKAFYLKIVSEINFIKIYLQFLKILGFLYNKVQNYDMMYFYSIIETKFKADYCGIPVDMDGNFSFLSELDGENKRINNITLIKHMTDKSSVSSSPFLSEKLLEECDHIIINQKFFLPDIYYWFNSKNRELTNDEINKIKKILTSKDTMILPREKVLLESLINKTKIETKQDNKVENVKTDTMKLECENIIEEYLLIKSFDDIKYFINTRCVDAISKNKFCEQIIDRYFLTNKEGMNDILDMIKLLIKNQVLFKSNLSRGLLMINNSWKDRTIDYNKPAERMKTLLTVLKNIGITKGLEFLLDLYNVE
jgi:hypothetical protein